MTDEILTNHFNSMFDSFLGNLAKRDYASLEKIMEKRFYEKLMSQKETLEKFEFNYEQTKEGEKESYLIDSLLVKGVYHDRSKNDTNHDYCYVDKYESLGLRFYLHKFFMGFTHYYFIQKNQIGMQKTKELMKNSNADILEILQNQDEFRDSYYR